MQCIYRVWSHTYKHPWHVAKLHPVPITLAKNAQRWGNARPELNVLRVRGVQRVSSVATATERQISIVNYFAKQTHSSNRQMQWDSIWKMFAEHTLSEWGQGAKNTKRMSCDWNLSLMRRRLIAEFASIFIDNQAVSHDVTHMGSKHSNNLRLPMSSIYRRAIMPTNAVSYYIYYYGKTHMLFIKPDPKPWFTKIR